MVDSSLYRLEPGVTLLVMMIVMNKGALVRLMFDHVERQGTFDTVFSHWCLLEGVRHRIYIVGGAIAFLSHTFLAVVLILSYVTKKDLVACSDGWFHCRQSTGVHVFFRKTRSCKKRCHEGGGGYPRLSAHRPRGDLPCSLRSKGCPPVCRGFNEPFVRVGPFVASGFRAGPSSSNIVCLLWASDVAHCA